MSHLTRRQALASFGTASAAALAGVSVHAQSSAAPAPPAAPIIPSPAASASLPSSHAATGATPATPAPASLLCLTDYEALARERMTAAAWEFIASGSADEITLRWNREALEGIRLQPKVLVDVGQIDTRLTLLGTALKHPILAAPTAAHMLVHPLGEVATARGCSAAGALMVASTMSNCPIEAICAASTEPMWFQLYAEADRGLTQARIARAEAAGCRALCITVDLNVLYGRNRVARVDDVTPNLPFPNLGVESARVNRARGGRRYPGFNWKDLEWLRRAAKTPIVLKGILNPADAARAVEAGVDAIIVSNHGGRALDSVPATIEALPRVAERVAGRIPLLVDGGFRRGTDVLKGLARGASAVLIGRPTLHGLAVNGDEGVRHVITLLRQELEAAMALTGCTKLSDIDASVLW